MATKYDSSVNVLGSIPDYSSMIDFICEYSGCAFEGQGSFSFRTHKTFSPLFSCHKNCHLSVCKRNPSTIVFRSIIITRILLSREVDGTLLADCIRQFSFPSHLRRGVNEGYISRANHTFCHRRIGTSPSHQGDGAGRVHLVGGDLEDLRFQVSYYSQEIKSC